MTASKKALFAAVQHTVTIVRKRISLLCSLACVAYGTACEAGTPASEFLHSHAAYCRVCDICNKYTCDLCGVSCDCAPIVRGGCESPESNAVLPYGNSIGRPSPLPTSTEPIDAFSPVPALAPEASSASNQATLESAPVMETPNPADLTAGKSSDGPSPFDMAAAMPAGAGAIAAAMGPQNMVGDFFGGSSSTCVFVPNTVRFSLTATSYFSTDVIFDVPPSQSYTDLYSVGSGRDTNFDERIDTYDIAPPSPPTDAPTSPGPGFTYDGGTASNPRANQFEDIIWDINYSYTERLKVNLPVQPGGGGAVVGRMKIAENTSPLPQHRIFFNYSMFDNVPLTRGGVTVNRFAPGLEKAFFGNLMSLEIRTPFAGTLDTNFIADDTAAQVRDVEFGDVFMSLKALLFQSGGRAISAGISWTLPTANDSSVSLSNGKELLRIENQAVHIMPYIGWLIAPNPRVFLQGFVQVDVDSNGNNVIGSPDGVNRTNLGTLRDVTFLYADIGAGYWVHHNPQAPTLVGFVPMVELHYNRSLESVDPFIAGPLQIGERQDDIQILNAVIAGNFVMRNNSTLTVGYAAPLATSADAQFDGELRAIWNRKF
ncbi:MAG: hypothetical protein R3C28_14200 [Pirellulaceae bacterium]